MTTRRVLVRVVGVTGLAIGVLLNLTVHSQPTVKKLPTMRQVVADASAAKGNPFWEHALGDPPSVPCTHLKPVHPKHPIRTACVHLIPQHPQGHPLPNVACLHKVQEHPGGHKTGARKPDGSQVIAPCTHLVTQHPGGDPVPPASCTHLSAQHPGGDDTGKTTACTHLQPEHPNGDPAPGPNLPCRHPVPLVSEDARFKFYTSNPALISAAQAAADKLEAAGVAMRRGRKLSIFNRAPVAAGDNRDPMWSHYNPSSHHIQIMNTESEPVPVLRHELGHAVLGHRCVVPLTLGLPHRFDTETDPGGAVSKGWANFVELFLTHSAGAPSAAFPRASMDAEAAERETKAPRTLRSEFRVAAILWDIFDTHDDGEKLSLPFSKLFQVYSPTLVTLDNGPLIATFDGYLTRLAENNPQHKGAITSVRDKNLK